MHAFTIPEFGFDKLALVNLPTPSPNHLSASQVLIRIRAVAINYRDLLMVRGLYDPRLEKGRVPCSDGAGEVVAVGSAVRSVKPGDLVCGAFLQNWHDGPVTSAKMRGALGGDADGMLRQFAVLDETGVIKAPAGYTAHQAATLPCAGVTAWNALFEGPVPLKPGESVLVQGTGGVSMFALQFAHSAGAVVIATSSSDDKLVKAKALGATHTINYKTNAAWDKPARDLTGGGVDVVVEVGGSGTLSQSLKAVRSGGSIPLIGVLSGGKGEVETVSILMRAIQIRGIYVGSTSMFRSMNRAIELHKIKPVIDKIFPFDQARQAMEYMLSGVHLGKVVVDVA